jgi:hypothetical protein
MLPRKKKLTKFDSAQNYYVLYVEKEGVTSSWKQ